MAEPAPATDPAPETLGFAGCLAELDGIVAGLESDTVDVDELTARVERATQLVTWCRERLHGTRLQVTELLDRLEDEGGPGAPADDDTAPGD